MPLAVARVVQEADDPAFGDRGAANFGLCETAFHSDRSQHVMCIHGLDFSDDRRGPVHDREERAISTFRAGVRFHRPKKAHGVCASVSAGNRRLRT
jgi:hypothetical protein